MILFQSLFAPLIVLATSPTFAQDRQPESVIKPLPMTHLSTNPYPEEVADETAYTRWLSHRSAGLRRAAEQAVDPRERVELSLAALNWALAAECEPPMSRMLQGISLDSDGAFLEQLTQRCLGELEALRGDVKRYVQDPDHDAEAAGQFRASMDTLECFARVLHACAAPDQSNGATEVYSQAARSLSAYIEDERSDVAAAALLWQAVLYGRGGRIDRALRLLPLVSEPLRRDTMRYDFFARLLRCQDLTQRGSYAAAWNLLLTLEERARDEFGTAATQAEAARSAILAKLAICDLWPEGAPQVERQETKSWCDSIVARLTSEYFGAGENGGLLRLATAAPIIVNIPDPDDLPPTPSQATPQQTDAQEPITEEEPTSPTRIPETESPEADAPPE